MGKGEAVRKTLCVFVCLGLLMVPFTGVQAQNVTKTQTIDFGDSGTVAADYSLSGGGVSIGAGFDFTAGIDLPVTMTMSYPNTTSAGEAIQVSISAQGGSGGIWYKFYGHADCSVMGYTLAEETINIPKNDVITFTVPIGENVTQNLTSNQITVANWHKDIDLIFDSYFIEADMRFAVDVEVTTSSYISGNVDITGTAIDVPVSGEHEWGSTYTNSVNVKSSAQPGDSVNISVSNLRYVLETIQVKIKTFHVYAGYNSDIDLVGSDPDALTATIPVTEFIPQDGTRADDRTNGDLIYSSNEISGSDFGATISIPQPPGLGGQLSNPLLWVAVIAVCCIVGVSTGIYMKRRSQRAKSSGTGTAMPVPPLIIAQTQPPSSQPQYYGLPQQPGPPGICIYCGTEMSSGASFCGNCGKTIPPPT